MKTPPLRFPTRTSTPGVTPLAHEHLGALKIQSKQLVKNVQRTGKAARALRAEQGRAEQRLFAFLTAH